MKRFTLMIAFLCLMLFPVMASAVGEATEARVVSSGYEMNVFMNNETAYAFMPSTCDLSNVTVTTLDQNGDVVFKKENINLLEDKLEIEVSGKTYNVVAMQSELPSLIFDIDEKHGTIENMHADKNHQVKCYGDVRLEIPAKVSEKNDWEGFISEENDEEKPGTVEIRGRGNTTWTWKEPGSKRPYQFKLEKKVNIFGMGAHKTWILLKNEDTLIRQKIGLDLGIMMGIKYTPQSEFVDLFMNGTYLGNYLLCEKVQIGDDRVNISNLDDEFEANGNSSEGLDLTGGYLIELDNWGDGAIKRMHKMCTYIVIKEPEDLAEKASDNNEYGYIMKRMTSLFDAIYSNGVMPDGKSYLEYIDMDSFARYFFHQEFVRNGDCGISSTYFYKDKDSKDPLIYAGPIWDNDRAYINQKYDGWIHQNVIMPGFKTKTIYNQLGRRLDFATLLIEKYENSDMKDTFKKAPELVDRYIETIGKSGEMNSIRWSLKKFDPAWIKTVMIQRAEWIEENYKTLLSVARDDGITVMVDDMPVIFDVKPTIKDNRTLVPVRAIFEALGAEVLWDNETQTVKATKENVKVSIPIGSKTMTVNNETKALDVSAVIEDGRTLVPVRAVSEAFECDVQWDNDTQTVLITVNN
ncbi:MAG: CotH kinase family protein [Clostridia bacterium]|nr:CotH kinase family protein [Clostridia bacterium]